MTWRHDPFPSPHAGHTATYSRSLTYWHYTPHLPHIDTPAEILRNRLFGLVFFEFHHTTCPATHTRGCAVCGRCQFPFLLDSLMLGFRWIARTSVRHCPLAYVACMGSPRLSFSPIIEWARRHHFLMVFRDQGGIVGKFFALMYWNDALV